MTKASKKRRGDLSTGGPSSDSGDTRAEKGGKRVRGTSSAPHPEIKDGKRKKGLSGVPGSKDDTKRCVATAHRTGERCRAPVVKGATVCRVHGGAAPQVKKAAKERLLALVDPALATLHGILSNPTTDDAVKVRAALGILDRTGFRPGMDISVHAETEWEKGIRESILESGGELPLDRRALDTGDERSEIEQKAYAGIQLAQAARDQAWEEYDAEDAPRNDHPFRNEHTVRGEVIGEGRDSDLFRDPMDPTRKHRQGTESDPSPYRGRYDRPTDRDKNDPPRYGDRP